MSITVTRTCVDADGTRESTVLYSGNLTPRRLAKAVKTTLAERAEFRRIFGPTVICPAVTVSLAINGELREASDLRQDHNEGATWAEICEGFQ